MDICSQILPTNTEDRYSSHHVHSPQFAGVSCTNATNRGRFGDSLYQLDEEVAAIMAGIVSTSQEANTLTVFTSESVAMPHDCALPLPLSPVSRAGSTFPNGFAGFLCAAAATALRCAIRFEVATLVCFAVAKVPFYRIIPPPSVCLFRCVRVCAVDQVTDCAAQARHLKAGFGFLRSSIGLGASNRTL